MKSPIKRLLLLFTLISLQISAFSQTSHLYSTEYSFLSLKKISEKEYLLKTDETGNDILKITYYTKKNDTLDVRKYSLLEQDEAYCLLDYNTDTNANKGSINKYGYEITTCVSKDSILIPLYFSNRTAEEVIVEDSLADNLIEAYQFIGGKRSFFLYLYKDNNFRYIYFDQQNKIQVKGSWNKKDDFLFLEPEEGKYSKSLWFICTNNVLSLYKNFAIGQRLLTHKKHNEKKYVYLNKVIVKRN